MEIGSLMSIVAISIIAVVFLWSPKKAWPYFLEAVVAIVTAVYCFPQTIPSITWPLTAILCFIKGLTFICHRKKSRSWVLV